MLSNVIPILNTVEDSSLTFFYRSCSSGSKNVIEDIRVQNEAKLVKRGVLKLAFTSMFVRQNIGQSRPMLHCSSVASLRNLYILRTSVAVNYAGSASD